MRLKKILCVGFALLLAAGISVSAAPANGLPYDSYIYDNDNDLGKRDLMEDIQKWTEDLAYNRKAQDDFWVGIFYPNVYDQFEFIELK